MTAASRNSDVAAPGIPRLLIARREAFDAIGVGGTVGAKLIASGQLEAVRLGGRTLVTMASVEAFIARLPRVAGSDPDTQRRSAQAKWLVARRRVRPVKGDLPTNPQM